MAIVFDATNKVIKLDSYSTSASILWSAWVDWYLTGDNSKYPIAFSQIGGVAPVALYLYLENGWRIRPKEANGTTTVSGNLLVQGGGSPIVSTLGNYNVLVNMETPIAAQAILVDGGSGTSTGGATAQEIWEYGNRELTSALPSGLDEIQLHAALDSYTHKDSYKADVSNVSANVVKVNGVAVSSINDFKTAEVTVDLSTIPQDVWTYGSRALTAAAGLTTEQAAKLNSLSNYTSIHADLDSYANKFAWKTDVSELINGVNIKQVAGTAVNSINDFKSAPVSLTALTAQIDGVQASVDTVDNKLDVLNTGAFTTADRNKLASLTNYDTLHEDLDTYGNKGLWKADVSSLASGVNVTKIAGVQVNGVDDFKSEAADLTPVLTAIAGLNDVTASEVRAAFDANDFKGENTETQIHSWLDSYGGKAQWKTDVSSLISGVNIKAVNGTVIAGINDFKAPATDLTPVITAINDVRVYTPSEIRAAFNPADFTSKNTQLEIHTWLDSYGNKSAWKADVNSLLAGVNVSKVAGVAVNGIADFRAPAVDLSGLNAKVDSVKNVLESVDDKADVLVAKDGFTGGDRSKLNSLTNYDSLHADLDGYANKALWKADLTPVIAGVNVVKVAGSSIASVEDFKAAPTDLSGVQSAIAELKVDSTVIKSKTAELTNYNDTVVKGKLDVLIAKDTFGPADRELATEVNGKIADLIADVEGSKVEVKAHVTSSVAPLATATNVAAIKMELDDVKASIDAILADMVALDSGSTASLYAKIAQLKADVANVQTTASELPDQVWSKVV